MKIHTKVLCRSSVRNFTRSFIHRDLFYTLGTPSFRTTWQSYSIFFLTAMYQEFTLFFSSKINPPVLFSNNQLLLIVIDKFANRNSCGYCFDVLENFHGNVCTKILSKVFAWQCANYSRLKFSPDSQNTEKLSRGVLHK